MLLWTTVASLAGLWLVQMLCAVRFAWLLRTAGAPPSPTAALPKFCIGLPLRGADPNLAQAIQRLLAQDYPDFELRIVVDHRTDPAWEIAHAAVRSLGVTNVRISELQTTRTTCSPYANSLAQYLDELDDTCGCVGFADADMVVPRDWLRCMATALQDERVGATLGNRWYVPHGRRWGTFVRYLWNAGAVVPMWLAEMPWTGALALRRTTVVTAGLPERLRRGMTEDAPVKNLVREQGLQLRFIPQLMIPNREETDLRSCYRFIQRQLFWTKLYHPHWWAVCANAAVLTLALFLPPLWAVVATVIGRWHEARVLAGAAAGYFVGMLLLSMLLETNVRRVLRGRLEPWTPFSWGTLGRIVLALPLTQALHAAAVASCLGRRCITWRGVRYQIDGPWSIQVLDNDRQAVPAAAPGDNVSLG